MPLRYPGSCASCGAELLEPGAVENAIDRGKAGASAAREWQRRHDNRERRVRKEFGRFGGLVLALTDDPHSTSAWAYGANGENALGAQLNELRQEGMAVIHDRRLRGSRANIDHLVVASSGVFVIDAKNYKGRVERSDRGGWFSTDYRLYVRGRDKTSLVGGMQKQIEAVKAVMGDDFGSVRVTPVICFVEADWSLFASPLQFGDVHVLWPRALAKLLRRDGPLSAEQITRMERMLALSLSAA
ncbi:MAG: nuclease-related domain-containing protein [Gaiellaceae bacterium]